LEFSRSEYFTISASHPSEQFTIASE